MWGNVFFFFRQYLIVVRRRQWHPTPVLLPGKSDGRRSLVGCSPWSHKESDMTERLHFHFSLSCFGEGNGNPLQCVLTWRIPGTAEPGGLPSMGSHRVGHDWKDLAAAAVSLVNVCIYGYAFSVIPNKSLPRVMSRFLHMFSSRNFIVSCPMFKTLVHFELIFPPLYVLGTLVKNQLTTYA